MSLLKKGFWAPWYWRYWKYTASFHYRCGSGCFNGGVWRLLTCAQRSPQGGAGMATVVSLPSNDRNNHFIILSISYLTCKLSKTAWAVKNIILLSQRVGFLQSFSKYITYQYKAFPEREHIHYLTHLLPEDCLLQQDLSCFPSGAFGKLIDSQQLSCLTSTGQRTL